MKLLITGAWKEARCHTSELKRMGYEILFMENEKGHLKNEYLLAEGVICNNLFLFHDIKSFRNLKFIQLTSAGLDRIPFEYIKERNISIYNARGVYSIPMAEFVMGAVLYYYKRIEDISKNKILHKWEKIRCLPELCGKTICIVGCGSVGSECAKRFLAFDMKVIGIDINTSHRSGFSCIKDPSLFNEVLPETDILLVTVPLNRTTFRMIGQDVFNRLKKGALVVNISRGAVIDTHALVTALKNEIIGGAILDVFEEEPLTENSDLWGYPNVFISSHNSFEGENNSKRLWDLIKRNLGTISK